MYLLHKHVMLCCIIPYPDYIVLSVGYKEMGAKGGAVTNEDTGKA